MPAGDAAALFGIEVRQESMDDQRDPNLMDKLPIQFQSLQIETIKYVQAKVILIQLHVQMCLMQWQVQHFLYLKYCK